MKYDPSKIRLARKKKKMVLRDLSRATGITINNLSRIERGLFPNPGVVTVQRIAIALKKKIQYFFS